MTVSTLDGDVTDVRVRPEEAADYEAVRQLHRAAFGDHGDVVAALVEDLRASAPPEQRLSLVADVGGSVVGHIHFRPALLDAPRRLVEVQTLSPLAVLPPLQRRGLGAALVRAGLDVMAERRVPVVFLEGDPRYYGRFGFKAGADLGFRRPSLRIPEAAFQAVALPAYESWMTGTFVYPDVFWRHDAVGLRAPTPTEPEFRQGQSGADQRSP